MFCVPNLFTHYKLTKSYKCFALSKCFSFRNKFLKPTILKNDG